MSTIQVAVGIMIDAQNQVLVALRPASKIMPNIWEFPGGKVEKNETVFQALQRELKEEINIQVITAKSLMTTQYLYQEKIIQLNVWKITEFKGDPMPCEGQGALEWVSIAELKKLAMPPGNQEIIDYLLNHG